MVMPTSSVEVDVAKLPPAAAVLNRVNATKSVIVLADVSGSMNDPAVNMTKVAVTRRNGFLLAQVDAPIGGSWSLSVSAPASGDFMGQIEVFAEAPNVFAEIWSEEIAENIYRVVFNAHFQTPLEELGEVSFTALCPRGELVIQMATSSVENAGAYQATFDLRNKGAGLWTVLGHGSVGGSTFNDPGEQLFGLPSNKAVVPPLSFSAQAALQSVK